MDFEALTAMIASHEGKRLKPYRDTVGKLTIGCGRNLDDVGITSEEADLLLQNDIERVVQELHRTIPWWVGLDDVRRMVLVDMAFNMGVPRLMKFNRMLNALFAEDYRTAAAEMLDSLWARQVGSRADELARMMITGKA